MLAIINHVLADLKIMGIQSVILRSDNAGKRLAKYDYHSNLKNCSLLSFGRPPCLSPRSERKQTSQY